MTAGERDVALTNDEWAWVATYMGGVSASEKAALRSYLNNRIAERVAQAKRDAVGPVVAACDELAADRDQLRAAYREHNAGRSPDRLPVRPDLATWANAYEVAERKVRAALGEQP